MSEQRVIAACDGCGLGYLSVAEIGCVCFCGRGRIWFLDFSESNERNDAETKERRRMFAVMHRLSIPPPSQEKGTTTP